MHMNFLLVRTKMISSDLDLPIFAIIVIIAFIFS